MASVQRLPFVRFVVEVMRLELTVPWRVLLAVAIDGVQPGALTGDEREVARQLFGDVETIDHDLRRVLVWRLGRASGKSTLSAALAIYCGWTSDLTGVGRGQIPTAFVVSPTTPVAKIAVRIARELVRDTELERYVETKGDTTDGFLLRRPDGKLVAIRLVAASKGGANLRGVDVIVLVLDESEFFASNPANDEGRADGYAVTDRDQIDAVMPRLLGHVVCISTPWPVPTATSDYFERNHGRPTDAVAALGPSMFMRPTSRLEKDIAKERARDEENAAREYDCLVTIRGGSRIFVDGLAEAVVERPLAIVAPTGAHVGCGGDLALERDSSAIAFAARSQDKTFDLLEFDEVRPMKGAPLAPGYVIGQRFAPLMKKHGARRVMMDAHYRQSAKEHLAEAALEMDDAPTGLEGKYDVYMFTRGLLRGGQLRLPDYARLLGQMRAVTAVPIAQGKTRIVSPRRAGQGHGDIVSAVVLAIRQAGQTRPRGPRPYPKQSVCTYRSPMDF